MSVRVICVLWFATLLGACGRPVEWPDAGPRNCMDMHSQATTLTQQLAQQYSACDAVEDCELGASFSCPAGSVWSVCRVMVNRTQRATFDQALVAASADFCTTTTECQQGYYESACSCVNPRCEDGGCACTWR